MKTKLLTLVLCLFSTLAFADGYEYEINMNQSYKYSKKRTIDANYDADKDYTIKLIGKYSDYNIVNWDEDRISFHVEIIAKSNKESALDDILSSIDVDFSDIKKSRETKIVEAKTKIDNLKLNNASISIDYYIMIPKGLDINVDNIYGDVDIQSAENVKMKLLYGDSDISEANNIDAEILYGDITIGTVNNFKADVKYSDIEIENVNKDFTTINIEAMYSDVSISLTNEHCFSYDISASYGSISPKMLKDNANRYIKELYKETIIGNINDNEKLHNINIEAMYGDVEIDFE